AGVAQFDRDPLEVLQQPFVLRRTAGASHGRSLLYPAQEPSSVSISSKISSALADWICSRVTAPSPFVATALAKSARRRFATRSLCSPTLIESSIVSSLSSSSSIGGRGGSTSPTFARRYCATAASVG